MWWTNPFWLLALVLVIPVLWLGGFTFNYKKQFTQSMIHSKAVSSGRSSLKRLTGLRVAAIIAVILGLAGTSILIPTEKSQLAILLDISASIGDLQIEESRATALRILKRLNASDSVALVTFAGKPLVLTPLVKPGDAITILESALLKPSQPEQTDLQAALRVGVELLKDRRGKRSIFLFSDGHPTSGGGTRALDSTVLTEARANGIPIYTIPVGVKNGGLFARGLTLPETIHPGETIQAQWRILADEPQDIFVRVKVDGKLTKRTQIRVPKGELSIPVTVNPQYSGVHKIEVEALGMDGKSIPQSVSGGLIQVSGPSSILVIHGDSSPALSRSFAIQGMQVTDRGFTGIPDSAGGYDAYTAVVLDNVPALYITQDQQNLLKNYVSTGGGLLVIGGDSSLGRGGYYASGLEDMLPVQTDTRQRLIFPRTSILFVIDHSGSMAETVGKTSKQLAAMQGVMAAINELSSQDEVGILSFDITPTWVLHFTTVRDRATISKSLSQIGEGGGTNLSTAIQEIINEFSTPGPVQRHVIMLTDGLTLSGNYRDLSLKLKSLGVTITTIGIGNSVDEKLLMNIARWGEGQYYRANLDQIPQIVQKETARITRDLIQEGVFKPVLKTATTALSGLENDLPPLTGYLITKPKELAAVYLQVNENDPLLAGWRYGNGQVIVFTSDSGRRWLAPWSENQVYNRFWSQIVRSLERVSMDQGLRVSVRAEAATAHIVVEATGADHRLRPGLQLIGNSGENKFNLKETAPGRYEATIEMTGSGIQQFKIYERQSSNWATGWVWNPPGAELATLGPDLSFLRQLSGNTGGKLLTANQAKAPGHKWAWTAWNLQNLFIILALLLFLAELGYRSTSLGQLAMARAVFTAWWGVQVRLAELVRGMRSTETISDNNGRQQTAEAYRVLAERSKQRREDEQKDLP